LPFSANDIYLEDNSKQVKAVCSNNSIARFLADSVNTFATMSTFDLDRSKAYRDFIESAYYLSIAIKKSNIPVNSVGTILLEKVFNLF